MKRLVLSKGDELKDVFTDFGIYTKSVPFKLYPKVKPFYSESWADEDGDDEFIPPAFKYEAYEMKVDFVYTGASYTANAKVKDFLDFLQGSELLMYDEFSRIGRKVRYDSVDDDATLFRRSIDVVEFRVNFKINDPILEVTPTYSGNKIIQLSV